MNKWIVVAVLALGCDGYTPPPISGTGTESRFVTAQGGNVYVEVFVDEARGATCWTYQGSHGRSISCLPTAALKQVSQ